MEQKKRKLFISFLGTGFYNECIYYDKNGKYKPTRYIQEATLEQIHAADWNETDAIRFFITEQAFTDNWDKSNSKRYNNKTKTNEDYVRLGTIINNLPLKADVKPVTKVPVGNNEEEIWQIFEIVFKEIQEGDELYIDLTHALRYLPMLVLVLSNYAKFLRNITIKHLSYGNYEGRNMETNEAPIVDLVPLAQLQDWTSAAQEYLKDGYVEELIKMFGLSNNNNHQGFSRKAANTFISILPTYINDRLTCRGPNIVNGDINNSLKASSEEIESLGVKAIDPIFTEIKKSIHSSGNMMSRVVDAASWCFEHHMWQQSLTILQEGLVTFFCNRHNLNVDDDNDRKLVTGAFSILSNNIQRTGWKVANGKLKFLITLLNDPLLKENSGTFKTLTDLRNNYNHAGFCHVGEINKKTIKKVIRKIKGSYLTSPNLPVFKKYDFSTSVFLNISNHSSEDWSPEQLSAAQKFGQVEDYKFPEVPAGANSEEIAELADQTVADIVKRYPDAEITAHVMGEMTLTFAIVARLKQMGIRCVASCTYRDVEELPDGRKVSQFHFTQFREY